MSDSSRAVFLSYAREDIDAARRIAEALRAAGIEVWFDETELGGGDAWDQKIRKQIKDCTLFVPVISASTQARREGYFRREWRLAVERMHDMDDALPFLVPVVIDDTEDAAAHVPDRFRERQWVRLPGGEPPPAFGERVKKLLARETAEPREPKTEGGGRPARHRLGDGGRADETRANRRWLAPAIGAGIAAVAFFAWLIGSGRFEGSKAKPSAAPTEAQQLVAKARQVWEEGDDINRETYTLAEELLVKAEKLDVSEASAWALHAQLSEIMYSFTLDQSAARLDAVRTQADRAVRLAPGSLPAELARAHAQYAFGQFGPALEEQLKSLAAKYPNDPQVYRLLSRSYMRGSKIPEALEANAEARRLLPGEPRLQNDRLTALHFAGRFAEAEVVTAEAMKGRRDARLLWYDVVSKLVWRGDLPAAFAAIQEWPPWMLREDRGAAAATIAALWAHEPEKALEFAQRLPRDYVRDTFFIGPRNVLSAWAHEQAGHQASARADWNVVLQVAEHELAAEPNNPVPLHWKAWALAKSGDTPAATAILQQLKERKVATTGLVYVAGGLAGLALMVGQTDEAIEQLANFRPNPAINSRPVTRTMLNLNPIFDPLRQDPRFHAMVTRAPGPSETEVSKSTDLTSAKSVAVLAFKNLTDEKDFFSDGISDELLNVLGRVPGLRVAGRESAFKFKGQPATPQEIGQQLGVSHLISGSVRKMGTRLRIYAELTSAMDGFRLWSDTIEKDAADVFAVQEEIAATVTQNLQLKLGTPRAVKPVNAEAHQLVLEGRYFVALRDPESLKKAQAAFTHATEIAPELGGAHAGLSEVFLMGATYAIQDGALSSDFQDDIRRGDQEARRAVELDPSAPDGFAVLAQNRVLNGRYREAEEQFQASLTLNPNHSTSNAWLAVLLLCEGQLERAERASAKSLEIDPFWTANLSTRTEILVLSRQFQDALHLSDRVQALRPGYVLDLGNRVRAQYALGQKNEALETARSIRRNLSMHPRRDADIAAIWVLRQAGQTAEAEAYGQEYLKTLPVDSQQRGFVLGALGRFDDALPFLERTPPVPRRRLYWDQMWDPWRNDPRFAQLMAKLGATAEYNTARATLAQVMKESAAAPQTGKSEAKK